MAILHENNYESTLAASIDNVQTSITVSSDVGFPPIGVSDTCTLTIDNGIDLEIVLVTSKTGTTLTVVRGHEGTTPSAFNAGDKIENRLTADTIDDKLSRTDDLQDDGTFTSPTSDTVASTSSIKTYVDNSAVQEASTAEVLAESITTKYMSPSNTKQHQGVAKVWATYDQSTGLVVLDSYNISSISDDGVGLSTVTLTNPMDNVNYGVVAMHESQVTGNVGAAGYAPGGTITTTSFELVTAKDNGDAIDSSRVSFVLFGDI